MPTFKRSTVPAEAGESKPAAEAGCSGVVQGSLSVKRPTIWRHEKQEEEEVVDDTEIFSQSGR